MATQQNRTLTFNGYAYGNTDVSINAIINGVEVFNGKVPTIVEYDVNPDMQNAPPLFTITDSTLFPTDFSGSYPVNITVSGGVSVYFGNIMSNYMQQFTNKSQVEMANSSIENNILTIGNIVSGVVEKNMILNFKEWQNHEPVKIIDGNENSWTVADPVLPTNIISISNQTIFGTILEVTPGTSDQFSLCYTGNPFNDEATSDARTDVVLNQYRMPMRDNRVEKSGNWMIEMQTPGTLTHTLWISRGNCVQV